MWLLYADKQPFTLCQSLFILDVNFMKYNIFFYLLLIFSVQLVAQSTITIGTGSSSNTNTSYPAPYGNWYQGAKHQMIIRATELNAAGMTAGNISSLAFNVATANGTALSSFSIAIGSTTKSSWTPFSDDFETGLTTVFTSTSYTETIGWNVHNFSTPFYWDGVSNLVVETCFNNGAFSNNASTYFSSTSYTSVMYLRRDDNTVCSTINNFNFNGSVDRPNIQFEWQAPNVPPVTDFTASSVASCSGQISFFDESTGSPTTWLWDFGDGNTSALQNPSHTYTSSGTYSVELTSTNQFGNHTETKINYIVVNLSASTPIAASCTPVTQNGSLGFGITNVSFNTINESTGDASEGYLDNTCSQTTVYAGQSYPITIQHAQPTIHNCVAWIDYNNDGVFDDLTEKIISSSSSLNTSGNVTISSIAVLNTPLRMRVIADYDLNAIPTPCANPVYGQAEDYTVIVEQDMSPPESNFETNQLVTCDGVVSFSDLSTNVPTTWQWSFGDGNSSIQQSPNHTYTTSGNYTVTLIVSNAFGTDTIAQTNLIQVNLVNNLVASQCNPVTLGHCCGYGIYQVNFNAGGIQKYSVGAEEGYQDFSCQNNDSIVGGQSYSISIRTGSDNPQDTRVWVDFNNNGIFENSEKVYEALNSYNPTGNIMLPSTGIIWDTPLRMRVVSDEVGAALGSCDDLTRGQAEDYFLKITEPLPDTTGFNEINNIQLAVFPNPSKGIVTVRSSSNIRSIKAYNIVGELVEFDEASVNSKLTTISMLGVVNGTYLLSVEFSNGSSKVQKIIVKK